MLRSRKRIASWLAVLLLAGCSQESATPEPAEEADTECSGDYDTFEVGMTKQAKPGGLRVTLENAEPAPPVVRGDNVWWLHVADADGSALEAAELFATPYMPKHQHGSAEVVVEELGQGSYRLSPIELIMPGVWEIPISVTPAAGDTSQTEFRFCIAEQ